MENGMEHGMGYGMKWNLFNFYKSQYSSVLCSCEMEILCVPIILATEIWNRPMEQGTEIGYVEHCLHPQNKTIISVTVIQLFSTLYPSSFAIILMEKKELVALL